MKLSWAILIFLFLPTLASAGQITVSDCDGINDHEQIQHALDYAAEHPGTTVYLPGPFTYNVEPNKMFVPSHTTITGDSTAVLKITKQDPDSPTPSVTRAIFQAASETTSYITFHGFEIDGNELNSWSVSGNDHINMIQLLGSSYVTVYDMSFKNGLGDAVKVRDGNDINIYNNNIDKIGHDGIYLMYVYAASVHDNWISCRDDAGIRIVDSDSVKIYKNEITSENHGGAGIEIQKSSDVQMTVEIYENEIYHIRDAGIWLYGYGSSTAATSEISIHDNDITECGIHRGGGVTIQGINALLENNKITDNNVYDVGIRALDINTYTADTSRDKPQGSGYVITLLDNELGSEVVNGLSGTHTVKYEDTKQGNNVITVGECDGNHDQEQINAALEQAESGDTVFLPAKTYYIDGPVNFKCSGVTLQGEPGTIIKVAKTSTQWFKGLTGLINSIGFDDITIKDIEIDGSCDELDNRLADSSSATSHDCERGIVIQGSSGDFVHNILIQNVVLNNLFSDGVHVRYAEDVIVDSCEMNNCQHDSIYFVLVRRGVMKNNEIAGITTDCTRFDNCEYSKAVYNTLFSYSGSNTNGAFKNGQNGVQVGDQGHSYGGGDPGKSKLIHTNNIEIAYNKIINCGLEAVLLDAANLGLGENIYVHDNEIIGDDEFETSGVPVEVLDGIEEVKNGKTPTKEQSGEIFDSIFDVLDLEFTNTGRTDQTAEDIDIELEEQTKGLVYGGMKIVGFADVVYIDGVPYIPDEDAILMKYKVIQSPDLIGWIGRIQKMEKIEEKYIKNGTAYAVLTVKSDWYTVKTDPATGQKRKSKIKTSTVEFKDSCPAYNILQDDGNPNAYVNVFSDTKNPIAKVTVGQNNATQRIEYIYEGNTTTHTFMIGERITDETCLQYTSYSRCDRWDGTIPHMGNDLLIVGEFSPDKLTINHYTPYESSQVTDIKIIYHKKESLNYNMFILKWFAYMFIGMFAGYKLMTIIIN